MGSPTQVEKPHSQTWGNAQARKRLKAADFHYLAKFTAFVTNELVEEYYNDLIDKFPDGRLDKESFIKTFHLAFPNRPEGKDHKVDLATVMAEMYRKGDADKNEKLELKELVEGMMSHPVTSKIIAIKTIDALLEMFS